MKKLSLYFLILCISFFIILCSKRSFKLSPEFINSFSGENDIYKLVYSYTQRPVYPDEPLYIEFISPVVSDDSVGSYIDTSFIESNVSGFKALWDNRSRIKIIHSLKPGEYSIRFNFKKLFNNIVAVESLPLNLIVVPFYVGFDHFIKYVDVDYVIAGAKVFTSASIDNNVVFIVDGKKVDFNVNRADSYFIVSSKIKKDENNKKVEIIVGDNKTSFFIPAKNKISVFDLKIENEANPAVVIVFSEPLDEEQDIRGLVRVEPFKDVVLRKIGEKVYIRGLEKGKSYNIKIEGIRGKYSGIMPEVITRGVNVDEEKPRIEFVSDGIFLPSANEYKLRFKSINVKSVNIIVKRVFSNNLTEFLHNENVSGARTRSDEFSYYIDRVGKDIFNKKVNINYKKNEWALNEIDLKKAIQNDSKGIYLVQIMFGRDDIDYTLDNSNERNEDDYYDESDPRSWGYLYKYGRRFKPVINSDIGILVKEIGGGYIVFVNDVNSSEPIDGVKLSLVSYQNQVIDVKNSDKNGTLFEIKDKSDAYYFMAEREDDRSFIIVNKGPLSKWSTDEFDTGGVSVDESNIKAYIYTERGVYRPGDEVNISVIVRDKSGTFENNHPVKLEVYDPEGKLVKTIVNKNGVDGFYSFKYETDSNDITGTYVAKVYAGPRVFNHSIRIESIVPYRLKVNLVSDKKKIIGREIDLSLNIMVNYLFGAPGSKLIYEIDRIVRKGVVETKFSNYFFDDETKDFYYEPNTIKTGETNDRGQDKINDNFVLDQSPSAIDLTYMAKVFEESGRPVIYNETVKVYPYEYITGLKMPNNDYGYFEVGKKIPFSLIVLKDDKIVEKKLSYTIYRVKNYWWWDYPSYHEFRKKFKLTKNLEVVKNGVITTKNGKPVDIDFIPDDWGYYLIEITGDENTSICAKFFNVFYWGSNYENPRSASILPINSDKEFYQVGDKAKISFSTPSSGNALISIEKRGTIIKSMWKKIEKDRMSIEIPIDSSMEPNVYVSVAVIQDYKVTLNDRPIRMYGILPIVIKSKDSKQDISIKGPDVIRPNQDFEISIQTTDNKKTQFTIAVVDEGILAITDFKKPDPESYFYAKERYFINNYDTYDLIIDMIKGIAHNRIAIGGGDYRTNVKLAEKMFPDSPEKRRFIPVSMFKGPIFTDEKGFAKVSFKMGDYTGAVRVMVVSANKNKYGSSEIIVPVKTELMASPVFPRFLRPSDEVQVPVTVFANQKNIGDVNVFIESDQLIDITKNNFKLSFNDIGKKTIYFKLKAQNNIGVSTIKVMAKSEKFEHTTTTYLPVQPVKRFVYERDVFKIENGKEKSFVLKNKGVLNSNLNTFIFFPFKPLNIKDRAEFLINYPYGCIEQTVSTAFPQLYLKSIFTNDTLKKYDQIDKNIESAIDRVMKFQRADGSFSYWPNQETDIWATNYAGHFLIEARKMGYNVPDDVIKRWVDFQIIKANDANDNIISRVYRLYLLALADSPQLGAMNLIVEQAKEGRLKLNNLEKIILASTYHIAGQTDLVNYFISNIDLSIEKYVYNSSTYGSWLRDKAMMLEGLINIGKENEATILFNEIIDELNSNTWYSTQTVGYCLLAIGKYLDFIKKDNSNSIIASVKIGDNVFNINSNDVITTLNIDPKYYGKEASVFISPKSGYNNIFVSHVWKGIPTGSIKPYSSKVSHKVYFYDKDKNAIDPISINQGTSMFVIVSITNRTNTYVDNMAFDFNLPATWEVENVRIVNNDLIPEWAYRDFKVSEPKYTDIRDDKITMFFNIGPNSTVSFIFKVNVVFRGLFNIPSSIVEAMYDNSYYSVNSDYLKTMVSGQ